MLFNLNLSDSGHSHDENELVKALEKVLSDDSSRSRYIPSTMEARRCAEGLLR